MWQAARRNLKRTGSLEAGLAWFGRCACTVIEFGKEDPSEPSGPESLHWKVEADLKVFRMTGSEGKC